RPAWRPRPRPCALCWPGCAAPTTMPAGISPTWPHLWTRRCDPARRGPRCGPLAPGPTCCVPGSSTRSSDMAGPAAFATDVQSKLREFKNLTDESAKMEKRIAGVVRDIDKLRAQAATVASPQLTQPMVKALGAVRRAADAVQQHVLDKSQYTSHEYRMSLA